MTTWFQQVVVATGRSRDGGLVDHVGRCARLGLNAVARFIQFLSNDDDFVELRRLSRVRCGWRIRRRVLASTK